MASEELYADLHGLPPILIHVGDGEVILDDSTRLRRCRLPPQPYGSLIRFALDTSSIVFGLCAATIGLRSYVRSHALLTSAGAAS